MRRVLALALLLGACKSVDAGTTDAGPAIAASTDLTPAKKPPPLRVAKLAAPALPDLPLTIAQQEPPAKLPFGLSRIVVAGSDRNCQGVWNGNELVATGCARGALLFGRDGNGAEPLVSERLLEAPEGALPSVVDHRLEKTEGPIRNQGLAPSCTAFAMAAAIDHAVARWSGNAPQVSAMQLWSRYHTAIEVRSIESNVGLTVAAETTWPFDVGEATQLLACDDGGPKGKCGRVPDPKKVEKATAAPIATFTHVEYLDDPDLGTIERKLAAGQDVIVAMNLPDAWVPKGKPGARYVPDYTTEAKDSGHAVLLAGYAALPHATYFLMHNSWGAGWGDGGYAWIHEATLRAHLHEALVLDAEPLDAGSTTRPKRQRGETTCTGELVPDSIKGACTPKCPDGSPRHDGVCAIAGQCPTGYVNLTGMCVLAAPTTKGASGGITWSCGPGGCTYVIPKKVDPQCTGATCLASCPAPAFRLAKEGGRLTCIE